MVLFIHFQRRYFTLKANFVLSHLANIDFFLPPSAFQIELKQAGLVLFNTFKGAEPPLAIWHKNPQLRLVLYGYSFFFFFNSSMLQYLFKRSAMHSSSKMTDKALHFALPYTISVQSLLSALPGSLA